MAKSTSSLFCHAIFYFLLIIHYLLEFANFPIKEKKSANPFFIIKEWADALCNSINYIKFGQNPSDAFKESEVSIFQKIGAESSHADMENHRKTSPKPAEISPIY